MASVTFFQVAAGLIPVLLLGGAITDRIRGFSEDLGSNPRVPPVLVVILFGFFPATAEVAAISGSLDQQPNRLDTWLVAVAVAFGTWALAAAVVWPWLLRYIPRSRVFLAITVVLALGTIVSSARWLESSVRLSRVQQAEDRTDALRRQVVRLTMARLAEVNADDKLADAQLQSGRLSTRHAARRRLENARARKRLVQRLTEFELEGYVRHEREILDQLLRGAG